MKTIVLSVLVLLSVSACAGSRLHKAQYWQRSNVSESAYMNGPKAQQMLNRDIARCVTELHELVRLGEIKDAIPTDYNGRVLDPDMLEVLDHDSPEREGSLLAEHTDYTDFYGCMGAKGWSRVKTMPY